MKIEPFFNFVALLSNIIHIPIISNHNIIMSEFTETELSLPIVEPKQQRKRRTPEEIASAKAEKVQKQQEKDLKKQERDQKREEIARKKESALIQKTLRSGPLVPGTGTMAIAAMTIFGLCRTNMSRVNLAFRQMIASRLIFPPKKNINKFATGGIAEECLSQLFCHLGLECSNVSEESNVIDLAIQVPIATETVDFKVSLKNSGKISAQPILENYRGQKRPEIRPLPPTFIIYTEMDIKRVRIVYLDEEIIRQGYSDITDEAEFHREIYLNGDSNLTFKSGFLAKFIPRLPDEYIVNAEYPEDLAGLSERNFAKLALDEVIRQLGGDTN
jgi:hypothetical protein